MNYSQQPILILTGMHRSGTSLASSLLQSAGVNIGKNLVPANEGNPKGYFENADFVNFHEEVLFSLGIDKIGWTTQEKITPPLEYHDRAKILIEQNLDINNCWGWKEPRTSLFLDFWSDLLPSARFIFLYRRPWEVIDSLYRRGDDIFVNNPSFALQVWSSYNHAISNFYQQYPEKCLLINLQQITNNPNFLVEIINQKFNLSLASVNADLYDRSSLKTDDYKSHRVHLIKTYFPEIWQQYQELNQLINYSDITIENLDNLPNNAWILQDWLDAKFCEKKLKQEKKNYDRQSDSLYQELGKIKGEKEELTFNLHESKEELSTTKLELEKSKTQVKSQLQLLSETQKILKITQDELIYTKEELKNYQQELYKIKLDFDKLNFYFDRSQEELKQTQDKWQNSEEKINTLTKEIEEYREIINSMESSKFWQIREKWFQVKRGLKLTDE